MNILYVIKGSTPDLNTEQGYIDRLENDLGHTVVTVEDQAVDIPMISDAAYDLVMFADSVNMNITGPQIRVVDKPFLSFTGGVYLGFSTSQGLGPTDTTVYVQDDQDSLSAGFPNGPLVLSTVAYQHQKINNPVVGARSPVRDGDNNPARIFISFLDKDVITSDSVPAPNLRGFFGSGRFTLSNVNASFWSLFDAMINEFNAAQFDISGTLYSDEANTIPYLSTGITWEAIDVATRTVTAIGTIETVSTNGFYQIDDPALVAGTYRLDFSSSDGVNLGSTRFTV